MKDLTIKSLARERNLEKQVEDLKVQKEAFASRLTSLKLHT
jgi:hypothetical protein